MCCIPLAIEAISLVVLVQAPRQKHYSPLFAMVDVRVPLRAACVLSLLLSLLLLSFLCRCCWCCCRGAACCCCCWVVVYCMVLPPPSSLLLQLLQALLLCLLPLSMLYPNLTCVLRVVFTMNRFFLPNVISRTPSVHRDSSF